MNAVSEIRAAGPLVVVVESTMHLSATLLELCDFLRIRVARVADGPALTRVLQAERPICVLAHAPQAGPLVCEALAVVAKVDRSLPVLLVTDDTLDEPAGLDAQPELAPLANLFWLPRRPGLRMLVEFLFMSERRSDTPGLMPVG